MEKLEERIIEIISDHNGVVKPFVETLSSEVKDIAIEFAKYHEEYYYLLPYSISESFERFLNERYK